MEGFMHTSKSSQQIETELRDEARLEITRLMYPFRYMA